MQQFSPYGTETLLDHHLAAFDEWLREALLLHWGSPSEISLFFTAVTLLDQLNVDPERFNWKLLSLILETEWTTGILASVVLALSKPIKVFDGRESQVAYLQLVSKFLMDRERAGDFCVDSSMYVKLTMQLLDILPGR